jgi:signal transduction histidine kinase
MSTSPLPTTRENLQNRGEQLFGWLVFILLTFYAYALFFQIPYVGIYWRTPDYVIETVFGDATQLQPGDRLIQVGAVSVSDYQASDQSLFAGYHTGDTVPLLIERNSQTISVSWTLPPPTNREIWDRLSNQWWLGFLFWGTGQAALLVIRPRNTRRQLFVAFCFLTALWVSASSVSRERIWFSPTLLRSVIWLCVPVYWHFHWQLPKASWRLPRPIGYAIYSLAVALALVEWAGLLPNTLYLIGFLLALLGSLSLLIINFIKQPESRRDLIPLGAAAVLAIGLPLITVAVTVAGITWQSALVGFVTLPLLPFTYFYISYRQQEVRANQVASLYLFFALVTATLVILVPIAQVWIAFPGNTLVIALVAAAGTGLFTHFGYQRFHRLVERYILRIPIAPARLARTFAERVALSSTQAELIQILRVDVLPSLLIRQSALYELSPGGLHLIYSQGLTDSELVQPDLLFDLFQKGRRDLSATAIGPLTQSLDWVRLPLPLTIGGQLTGLWLLGRRDPDNQYPLEVIDLLIILANQTAMALSNLTQAERVRALSQANIEQTESQRAHLARELHDNLLQTLAHLETTLDGKSTAPSVFEILDSMVSNVRQTISDLRPPVLNYGLRLALESLADTLSERGSTLVHVRLEAPDKGVRYDQAVELHVYRIVQQACDNAFQHAQAKTITIDGVLGADHIELTVADDGRGFAAPAQLQISGWVTQQHYGLAGMMERARIINATLTVDSQPGHGTQVRLRWTQAT